MKVLITGSQGFIAKHLIRYLNSNTKWKIYGLHRHTDIKESVIHDLRNSIKNIGRYDLIIHLAAMSHVDRSIKYPYDAILDNVVGTFNVLEYARKTKPRLVLYFSTDEVFGPNINGEKFKEWDRFKPGSPYSATKAAGEDLALAYHNTYKVPIIITHCMNVFGTHQNEEKFIPKAVKLIKNNKTVPIYADKNGKKSGSRSYIHVDDVSRAILFLIKKGKIGEKYNIPGTKEISNSEMASLVAKVLGKKLNTKYISSDKVRPGNDFSYGINGSKLMEMGWKPKENTDERLIEVIKWYDKN